jgi:hypothetical protein
MRKVDYFLKISGLPRHFAGSGGSGGSGGL